LSTKAVNHSELFPMARQFKTQRLAEQREFDSKEMFKTVCHDVNGCWGLLPIGPLGGSGGGHSRIRILMVSSGALAG
jgi:hypothetical protein